MNSAFAYVDAMEMENVSGDPKPARVTLVVRYDQRQARIELPVTEPLFEREPGTEVYRRELQRLLTGVAGSGSVASRHTLAIPE